MSLFSFANSSYNFIGKVDPEKVIIAPDAYHFKFKEIFDLNENEYEQFKKILNSRGYSSSFLLSTATSASSSTYSSSSSRLLRTPTKEWIQSSKNKRHQKLFSILWPEFYDETTKNFESSSAIKTVTFSEKQDFLNEYIRFLEEKLKTSSLISTASSIEEDEKTELKEDVCIYNGMIATNQQNILEEKVEIIKDINSETKVEEKSTHSSESEGRNEILINNLISMQEKTTQDVQHVLSDLKTDLNSTIIGLTTIQHDLVKCQASSSEVYENNIKQLTSKIELIENKITTLNADFESKSLKKEDIKEMHHEDLKQITDKIESIESKISILNTDLDSKCLKKEEVKEIHETDLKNLTSKIETIESKITTLNADFESKSLKKEDIKEMHHEDLKQLTEKIESIESKLMTINAEIESRNSKTEEAKEIARSPSPPLSIKIEVTPIKKTVDELISGYDYAEKHVKTNTPIYVKNEKKDIVLVDEIITNVKKIHGDIKSIRKEDDLAVSYSNFKSYLNELNRINKKEKEKEEERRNYCRKKLEPLNYDKSCYSSHDCCNHFHKHNHYYNSKHCSCCCDKCFKSSSCDFTDNFIYKTTKKKYYVYDTSSDEDF